MTAASPPLSAPRSKTLMGTGLRPPSPAITQTKRLDAFTVVRRLGVGPDGASVLARGADGVEVELVFLSRVAPGSEGWRQAQERFQRTALVKHPVVRAILDVVDVGPSPAVQLEWPKGVLLADRLDEGPMTRRAVLTVMERLAHGVATAHRMGLCHGDLCPSSILVDAEGLPRLQFTGLRVRGSDAVHALDVPCLPPERDESVDVDTDAYAIAALTLSMLAGKPLTRPEMLALAHTLGPAAEAFASAISESRELRASVSELCVGLRELVRSETKGATSDTLLSTSLTGDLLSRVSATGTHAAKLEAGAQLGRFKLTRLLGQGGMGQVFEGVDLSNGQAVAVKVLHAELARDETLLRRFRKEARLLQEVRSPYVANLVDINADQGVAYFALEFVEGISLGDWLDQTPGRPLPEREALEILADACSALAEPHRRGIVHRDLKPDNLMFARADRARVPGGPRVKVVDFGIARGVDDTTVADSKLTQEGTIIGTPLFMAPEQCRAQAVSPATDVYALGVTLYLLLCGRTPFEGDQPTELFIKHVGAPVPPLHDRAPEVSDGTLAIVDRALKKDPRERFTDAGELLEAIERLLRGEPTAVEIHPALPDAPAESVREILLEMDFAASPEQLWPYLSDSDRLNRLVGMPAPRFEVRGMADIGESQQEGSYQISGLKLRWKEAPFEWVEGRRWGSYRVFESGPMRWFVVDIGLERKPEGGTHVRYRMRYVPRNALLGLVVQFELRFKQFPKLRKAFRKIDALLTGKLARSPDVDPFEDSSKLSRAAERRLAQVATQLIAEGRDPKVVEHLAVFLRSAPEAEVTRLRPLVFANQFSLDSDEVVAACLHGARKGILLLTWDVLCPLCRVPSSFADSLRDIEDHASCAACSLEYNLDFARSIELVFRVAPSIRKVERRPYCVGGPALFPHVAAQLRLRPGERVNVALALEAGQHRIRSPQLTHTLDVRVTAGSLRRRADLVLDARFPAANDAIHLGTGDQQLLVTNGLDHELLLRVERMAQRTDALTAARAASMPVFRELFPDEVLAPGQLVVMTNTALVATSIPGVDAVFAKLGDARAFDLVLKHLRRAGEIVHNHKGAIVKTLDAGIVAAFEVPLDAAACALELGEAALQLQAQDGTRLPATRVAVHQGPVMAATIDERLDYFGQNVSTLRALLEQGRPGEMLFSRAVFDDPEIAALITARGARPEAFALPSWGASMWAVRFPIAVSRAAVDA